MLHNDRSLLQKILPRNEGKLKSYDSCFDFRAWSHERTKRNQYLKQWMKADMPICFLPVRTLTSVLEKMTITSRPTVPPKCHPDCKSKILFENIYKSCDAMKKCLSDTRSFDRFLEEEEIETSHWPCDRCLDALKTIKLFWKVFVDKVFKVNLMRLPCSNENVRHKNSVKSIANSWCKEIIQQSFYIRCNNRKPTLDQNPLDSCSCDHFFTKASSRSDLKNRRCKSEFAYERGSISGLISGRIEAPNISKLLRESRCIQTDISFIDKVKDVKKVSKYTSIRGEPIEQGCAPCNCAESVDKLQHKLHSERLNNERLRREITSLRFELKSVYENCTWKMSYDPNKNLSCNVKLVPKCSESRSTVEDGTSYKLNSETVITMKKLQNKNYDHVSLLQVLHKTNKPTIDEIMLGDHLNEKECVPLNLLNGVKNTFESLIKREWAKAANQQQRPAGVASFKKTHSSSSFSRTTYSSDLVFDNLSSNGKSNTLPYSMESK